jgi:hypothetical protein
MNRMVGIIVAGLASGAAYLAAQAIDIAVTGNKIDDRLLAGALVPVDRADARSVGAVMHGVNSVAFAAAFRWIGRDLLAGPMWLRGMAFALIETIALYPLSIFEPYHPAIRDGRLPSYRTPLAFAQQVWRHVVLGIILGLLTPKRG